MKRKIKYRRQKRVILYLRGGDIQGASDVPPGFEVEVRDYDTDGTDRMVKRDEDGNAYLPLVIGGPMVRTRNRSTTKGGHCHAVVHGSQSEG